MKKIYIDPPYSVYNNDKLFDLSNQHLNRDDQLLPFVRARNYCNLNGIQVNTLDLKTESVEFDYFSFGNLDYEMLAADNIGVVLNSFILMEPPLVIPDLYNKLGQLSHDFNSIYIHNITGDGYDIDACVRSKLKKFYWPIPYDKVIDKYWNVVDRMKKVVVINGNHNPRGGKNELYSKRIEVMNELSKHKFVDLYGKGWDKFWSKESRCLNYWLNIIMISSIYKGSCISKFDTFSKYSYCLCFENMKMSGYITEKIFDCFYSGVIPIYYGAPDVTNYIPKDAFIDYREFEDDIDMHHYLSSLSSKSISHYRNNAKDFLNGGGADLFYKSLQNILTIL